MKPFCPKPAPQPPCGRKWRPALGAVLLLMAMAPALAQPATAPKPTAVLPVDAPGPVGGVPPQLPELKMPSAEQVRQVMPRPVAAATAALGFGRQRLALVLGMGTLGSSPVLESAARDSLAMATALRAAGFVVMVREDANRTELRAALQDFRQRLLPDGMGLLYVTGLAAQVDGRNLLLARDTPLEAAAPATTVAEHLRGQAVPLQELVDALAGPAGGAAAAHSAATPADATSAAGAARLGTTRLLVVDAAYQHPALDKLPQPGLTAQPLPSGVMALFARPPQVVQARPAVAPLPTPAPTNAQLLAASPFARLLVQAVLTPKLSGAEVLRSTQRALSESTQGAVVPWVAGDTDSSEEMAELSLLDLVLPRTPEEYTREGAQRAVAQMMRGDAARAGEQPVSEVLQQAQAPASPAAPSAPAAPAQPAGGAGPSPAAPDNSRTSLPEVPGGSSALGSVSSTLGTAASVAGTVAGVAATAATVAVGVKAAQASAAVAAVSSASTVVGAATAVAGNVVGMATRLGSSGAGESSARQVVATAPAAAVAAAPAAAAVTPPMTAAIATAATTATATITTAPITGGAATATRALAAKAGEMSVAEVLKDNPPARPQTTAPAGAPAHAALPPGTDGRTVRNSSGGERPAYNPRTNSHGYAEGDTFTYRVTDTWKDEVTGRYTTAIEEVLDNGQLLANSQQVALDPQGRLQLLRGADGSLQRFEPYQDLWWSQPAAGQSRDVSFKEIFQRADKTQGQTLYKGSSSVGRPQKVETPAGEFEALPIETSGWYEEVLANGTRTVGKFERTVWYSQQLGHPVAIDIKDTDRLGKLLKRERVDLVHAQQMRNPP